MGSVSLKRANVSQSAPVFPCTVGDQFRIRRGGRIVSVAAIMAVGVNADRRREVLGMEIDNSEIRRSVPSSCAR